MLSCCEEDPCMRCRQSGLNQLCENSAAGIVLGLNPKRGGRGFHDFYNQLEALYEGNPNPRILRYWWGGIFAAAQSDECLMDALLCKAIINRMSKLNMVSSAIPKQAIEYYSRSLRRGHFNQGNTYESLASFLMITNTYICIEWQMARYENVDILARLAFSVWYSNKDSVWRDNTRDLLTLTIMVEFMHMVCHGPIDTARIPLDQWRAFFLIAMNIAVDVKVSEMYILELQLMDIVFRLHRSRFTDPELTWKVIAWEHNVVYATNLHPVNSKERQRCWQMRTNFGTTKLLWAYRNRYSHPNDYFETIFKNLVVEMITWTEIWADREVSNGRTDAPFIHMGLSSIMLPRMLEVVHCSRDASTCQRVVSVLAKFAPWLDYSQGFANYLEELVRAGATGQPTDLEVECFGQDTTVVLDKAQLYRLTDQVAVRWARNVGTVY